MTSSQVSIVTRPQSTCLSKQNSRGTKAEEAAGLELRFTDQSSAVLVRPQAHIHKPHQQQVDTYKWVLVLTQLCLPACSQPHPPVLLALLTAASWPGCAGSDVVSCQETACECVDGCPKIKGLPVGYLLAGIT